mgnify:CR=1 FL=1
MHESALSLKILQACDWVDILVAQYRRFRERCCTMDYKRLSLVHSVCPSVVQAPHAIEINAPMQCDVSILNTKHSRDRNSIIPEPRMLTDHVPKVACLLGIVYT